MDTVCVNDTIRADTVRLWVRVTGVLAVSLHARRTCIISGLIYTLFMIDTRIEMRVHCTREAATGYGSANSSNITDKLTKHAPILLTVLLWLASRTVLTFAISCKNKAQY